MATLIRIGNSQGIRIPKVIIEQAQLENTELEFKVINDGLLIHPVKKPREGWKKQFDKALESQDDEKEQEWLNAPLSKNEDWEW
ncbi:MAG: AbrB/MazE/SpoVT family DNA-binding domain-containing protein [Deltaproteobacteria bacterium]|nr:AbrB/MazE/SpoVT family DNA-binding domain-containing protein [Deltaproteobacteria bacterium]